MNREIKFRAWDKDEKEMVSWKKLIDYCDLDYLFGNINETPKRVTIPDFDVMQYTGLKDVNGVEIYEGDIVRCFRDDLSEVVFKKGCFGLETYTAIGNHYSTFNEVYGCCEIIGNIYENPELLEVES